MPWFCHEVMSYDPSAVQSNVLLALDINHSRALRIHRPLTLPYILHSVYSAGAPLLASGAPARAAFASISLDSDRASFSLPLAQRLRKSCRSRRLHVMGLFAFSPALMESQNRPASV